MKNLISIFIVLAAQTVMANTLSSAAESFRYTDYYQFRVQLNEAEIDLLSMAHVRGTFPRPSERYDRQKHFGAWIHPTNDNECLDTRGLVLERDAVHRSVKTNRQCRVNQGMWWDPYTGQYLNSPQDVQIDHMVPLKNAYMTGAYKWDSNKRCLYANYMGNKFHLISVQGAANQSKSDRAPDEYVPPNKKFVCKYLKYWLEVKLIWNLKITPPERAGILKTVAQEKCAAKDFKIEYAEYQKQQDFIKENANLCNK